MVKQSTGTVDCESVDEDKLTPEEADQDEIENEEEGGVQCSSLISEGLSLSGFSFQLALLCSLFSCSRLRRLPDIFVHN